ncbi:DUF927 domain-containing protein [Mannheimia sp. AT1]|uniref:DUF927 domain-containing protein n=1 Tax=Mannheimia cairinae TaxID=3025936 RepID=A0ABT5MLN7_9PAST|nr:DUF927 domain-containing protein [Mannheimia cairinae]MDD0823105.1 DUF927 domain-containing protein [Mannheimia cairinae]MDD0825870.1 DUF927 domain-containing protein [Mannheimia cairinae]
MNPNQKPQYARNAKAQTAGKFDEIIAFVGTEAEPYNEAGIKLAMEAMRVEPNYKPVFVGKKELGLLPNVRLTPASNQCNQLSLIQLGELTEDHKTLICTAIARNSPNVKTTVLYDCALQNNENMSHYIEKIRTDNDEAVKTIIADFQMKNEANQQPKEPYFQEMEVNGIKGIYYIIPKLDKDGDVISEKIKWTCEPLTLRGEGYNESKEAFYIFEWNHPLTNKPHTEAIPLPIFGKNAGWEMMERYGFKITRKTHASDLADYFHHSGNHSTKWKVTDTAGWKEENNGYLLPNGEMIGQIEQPIFFLKNNDGEDPYSTKGTLESWQTEIGQYLKGNHCLILAIATALASPLLRILNIQSFGVHLYDDSSKGKTTSLNIANSIWGNPLLLNKKWDQTNVAIMNNAQNRNDNFLTLDEIGQAANYENVENAAYILFNETGRDRGKKTGGNQKTARWKLTALSTGESDLESFIQKHNPKTQIKAGQLVRLLNIPIVEAKNLHHFKNGKEHADHLNDSAMNNYGVLGREWINFIIQNKEQVIQTFKDCKKQWVERTPEEASGQVQRVVTSFTVLETALQLARNLTGFSEEENREAIIKSFNSWIAVFGTKSKEETNIIEAFSDWLQQARHTDFIEISSNDYSTKRTPTRTIAGYKIPAEHKELSKKGGKYKNEHFYIYAGTFKEVIRGRAKEVAFRALSEAGYLDSELEHNPRSYQKKIPRGIDPTQSYAYLVFQVA